jgi:hypothetical protein
MIADDTIHFLVGGRAVVSVSTTEEVIINDGLDADDLRSAIRILAPIAARYLANLSPTEDTRHHG